MKEADGAAPGGGRTDGRTDGQVGEGGGQLPISTVHGGSRSPGGGDTAGQHKWVEHLSEDTNKVEMMVKAMGHRAGTRDTPGMTGEK